MREQARYYVKEHKPMVIIGSPPCDSINEFNNKEKIEYLIHLEFCAEVLRRHGWLEDLSAFQKTFCCKPKVTGSNKSADAKIAGITPA